MELRLNVNGNGLGLFRLQRRALSVRFLVRNKMGIQIWAVSLWDNAFGYKVMTCLGGGSIGDSLECF